MAPEGAWYKKFKKKKRFCPYNTASDNPILIFNEYEIQYFGKELKILRIAMWQNIKYKLPKTGSKMSFIAHFYSLLMKNVFRTKVNHFEVF